MCAACPHTHPPYPRPPPPLHPLPFLTAGTVNPIPCGHKWACPPGSAEQRVPAPRRSPTSWQAPVLGAVGALIGLLCACWGMGTLFKRRTQRRLACIPFQDIALEPGVVGGGEDASGRAVVGWGLWRGVAVVVKELPLVRGVPQAGAVPLGKQARALPRDAAVATTLGLAPTLAVGPLVGVRHPNLVRVLGACTHPTVPTPMVVVERVTGTSLSAWIREHRAASLQVCVCE